MKWENSAAPQIKDEVCVVPDAEQVPQKDPQGQSSGHCASVTLRHGLFSGGAAGLGLKSLMVLRAGVEAWMPSGAHLFAGSVCGGGREAGGRGWGRIVGRGGGGPRG